MITATRLTNVDEAQRYFDARLAELDPAGAPTIRNISDIASVFTFAAEERTFLAEGFLPEGSVILLTSESGQGKTMLSLNLAACVATGQPFAGRSTIRRPVLYLDKENPSTVIAERLKIFRATDGEMLRIWGTWLGEEPVAVTSPIILEWVKAVDPKPLIVVDSLVAFHPGAENDSTETRSFMHGFRQLAALGATVLLLHHSGKGETSKDYRGSSDIKAAVDIGYHLANIGNPTLLDMVKIRAFKQRFPVEGEMMLRFGDGGFQACAGSAAPTVAEILTNLLRNHSGIRANEFEALAVEKDLPRDRAREFLKQGVKGGVVIVDKGDHNAKFYTLKPRSTDFD